MIQETLHRHAPDERFSRKVVDGLLARPRLLEIEGHPIRVIVDQMQAALAGYLVIEGDEVVAERDAAGVGSGVDRLYHVDEGRVLRAETTVTTFGAMVGRTPPVRLITAGRVFRACPEDARHRQVFHQLDALCIEAGADQDALKVAVRRAADAVLQPVPVKWERAEYPGVEHGLDISIEYRGQWLEIGGAGLLTAETLRDAGYDPEVVSGFAFGLGLERIAMAIHSLDDIRKLWQPPYVPH